MILSFMWDIWSLFISDDELRFGDEIEVGIIKIDKVAKTVKICVKSAEIRDVSFPRGMTTIKS